LNSLPANQEENHLVQRAKQDPAAFAELYDRHFLRIYRFVYSRVRDQSLAEDVTSVVFMKALRGIGHYQDMGRPFVTWLYQIASNAVTDSFRSARPTEDIDDQSHLASAGLTVEEAAQHRDVMRQIWGVVETLPQQQRKALILKFQEDMKIDDIAAILGKSPGAVKLLIHRGMSKLRSEFVEP